MFEQTYKKQILISGTQPLVDELGFVYHDLTLGTLESGLTKNDKIISYGLMLPNVWDTPENEPMKFCILDKEWRFLNQENKWTQLK